MYAYRKPHGAIHLSCFSLISAVHITPTHIRTISPPYPSTLLHFISFYVYSPCITCKLIFIILLSSIHLLARVLYIKLTFIHCPHSPLSYILLVTPSTTSSPYLTLSACLSSLTLPIPLHMPIHMTLHTNPSHQATKQVIQRECPGLVIAIMKACIDITPMAMLSR